MVTTRYRAWVLDGSKAKGKLVVTVGDQRNELSPGESVSIAEGELRYEGLSTWMGYRIFYDPTINWLFVVAVAGVLGLMQYFYQKINLQPWLEEESVNISDATSEPGNVANSPPNCASGQTQKDYGTQPNPSLQGKHA